MGQSTRAFYDESRKVAISTYPPTYQPTSLPTHLPRDVGPPRQSFDYDLVPPVSTTLLLPQHLDALQRTQQQEYKRKYHDVNVLLFVVGREGIEEKEGRGEL